ncbi:MAG: CBS domain-containing protein [Alphaproteobacteria bacterium]|nr:CBS domain-containing protein [Alphaproteobacteria bacterium]
MKIKDILSRDVELANPDTTIADVARKMKERNCGSIPVSENDRLVGMITDRDIAIRCVAEGLDCASMTAEQIMTPGILYCYDDEDAEEVARNMAETKVRRLPVVNRDKKLVGIVSLGDLAVGCEDESITGEVLERIRLAA